MALLTKLHSDEVLTLFGIPILHRILTDTDICKLSMGVLHSIGEQKGCSLFRITVKRSYH